VPGGGGGCFASGRERTREGVPQATRPLLLLLSVLQRPRRVETWWKIKEEKKKRRGSEEGLGGISIDLTHKTHTESHPPCVYVRVVPV
jgi:hypothetical protein